MGPTYQVDPQLSDNDVVDGSDDFAPGVVASSAMENQVGVSSGVDGQVLPSELGGHRILLPQSPLPVLHMHGKHRRVVAHLHARKENNWK